MRRRAYIPQPTDAAFLKPNIAHALLQRGAQSAAVESVVMLLREVVYFLADEYVNHEDLRDPSIAEKDVALGQTLTILARKLIQVASGFETIGTPPRTAGARWSYIPQPTDAAFLKQNIANALKHRGAKSSALEYVVALLREVVYFLAGFYQNHEDLRDPIEAQRKEKLDKALVLIARKIIQISAGFETIGTPARTAGISVPSVIYLAVRPISATKRGVFNIDVIRAFSKLMVPLTHPDVSEAAGSIRAGQPKYGPSLNRIEEMKGMGSETIVPLYLNEDVKMAGLLTVINRMLAGFKLTAEIIPEYREPEVVQIGAHLDFWEQGTPVVITRDYRGIGGAVTKGMKGTLVMWGSGPHGDMATIDFGDAINPVQRMLSNGKSTMVPKSIVKRASTTTGKKAKRLNRLWVVTDPSPASTLEDILFEMPLSDEHFANWIRGGAAGSFSAEHTALYDEGRSALKDAVGRLRKQQGTAKAADWRYSGDKRNAGYQGNPDGQDIYPNDVDHGYNQPLSGGFDIMKSLQNRLLVEQGKAPRPSNPRLASLRAEVRRLRAQMAARRKKAGEVNLMDYVLPQRNLMDVQDRVSEQAYRMAVNAYRALSKRLKLDAGQAEALSRLKDVADRGASMQADLIRNTVFKAAHAMKMNLPSNMFASVRKKAGEEDTPLELALDKNMMRRNILRSAKGDTQTYELAMQVWGALAAATRLSQDEGYALRFLRSAVQKDHAAPEHDIFRAADLLGIKAVPGMF